MGRLSVDTPMEDIGQDFEADIRLVDNHLDLVEEDMLLLEDTLVDWVDNRRRNSFLTG